MLNDVIISFDLSIGSYIFLPMKNRLPQYFISHKTKYRLTFLGGVALLILLFSFVYLSRHFWFDCASSIITASDSNRKCDVIVFESWSYPQRYVMQTALTLQRNGMGKIVYFTEYLPNDHATMSDVEIPKYYRQMLDLYFKGEEIDYSMIRHILIVPKDPITWNTAVTVIDSIANCGYKSMVLVSPWYHSRRSFNVFDEAGKRRGVQVFCKPVEGGMTRSNWWKTHAGLTQVMGEIVKLIYYYFKVT